MAGDGGGIRGQLGPDGRQAVRVRRSRVGVQIALRCRGGREARTVLFGGEISGVGVVAPGVGFDPVVGRQGGQRFQRRGVALFGQESGMAADFPSVGRAGGERVARRRADRREGFRVAGDGSRFRGQFVADFRQAVRVQRVRMGVQIALRGSGGREARKVLFGGEIPGVGVVAPGVGFVPVVGRQDGQRLQRRGIRFLRDSGRGPVAHRRVRAEGDGAEAGRRRSGGIECPVVQGVGHLVDVGSVLPFHDSAAGLALHVRVDLQAHQILHDAGVHERPRAERAQHVKLGVGGPRGLVAIPDVGELVVRAGNVSGVVVGEVVGDRGMRAIDVAAVQEPAQGNAADGVDDRPRRHDAVIAERGVADVAHVQKRRRIRLADADRMDGDDFRPREAAAFRRLRQGSRFRIARQIIRQRVGHGACRDEPLRQGRRVGFRVQRRAGRIVARRLVGGRDAAFQIGHGLQGVGIGLDVDGGARGIGRERAVRGFDDPVEERGGQAHHGAGDGGGGNGAPVGPRPVQRGSEFEREIVADRSALEMHSLAGVVPGDFDFAGPDRGIESRQQA